MPDNGRRLANLGDRCDAMGSALAVLGHRGQVAADHAACAGLAFDALAGTVATAADVAALWANVLGLADALDALDVDDVAAASG